MDTYEEILNREVLYDGSVVHLEKWVVRLPDGKTALREIVQHVGAVAVVACDENGMISMVRQYRVAIGREMLEIPAGKLVSRQEDRLEAAQRELREETGLTAGKWTPLCEVITTPGFCDETIGMYLATDLTQGNAHPDEDEFLNACKMPAREVYAMIGRGEIHDAKSVCALLLARPHLAAAGYI
ncbi:MAG: NUDIX hydrolase [Clostridia bacterium]|nr:NUDIX hydrolase [Clostridia bacterium]